MTYIYISWFLPVPDGLHLKPRNVSGKILDRNGQLLYEIITPGEGWRTYVQLADIPLDFQHAIIAVEDSEFYNHSGVDYGAIARAVFFNYLEQKITSGASTIPQQLVRNLLGTEKERSYQQKLKEAAYAIRLSNLYSKDQILEQYINTVYFGNLSYGVAEASQNYFAKNIKSLDLAELSMLAGLPKAPGTYNPLVNPQKAKTRQKYVLERMLEEGYITEQQMEEAYNRKLKFASGKTSLKAPHFVLKLLSELEEDLGADYLYSGLTITTTLDLDLQMQAEDIVARNLEKLEDKNVTNAALLAASVPDGQILAWVGSADFYNDSIDGQVNIVTSLRQPGSALKPFLYLLALEGGDTLATIIEDLPIKVKTESGIYSPLNYDLDFHGPVRIKEALANSFNIPAVRTQEKLGTANFLNFLHRFGLTSLDKAPDYYGLALTLGGGEIRMFDLANAYLTIARSGNRKDFVKVLTIMDSMGDLVYSYPGLGRNDVDKLGMIWGETKGNMLGIHGQENAALITEAISDPDARLKSFGMGNMLELSVPAAVKTGTTRNFKDNWTFGFSPLLLTSVWVGNADASAMENISGIDGAGPIWRDFMEYYHSKLPGNLPQNFAKPPSLRQTAICKISGLLPTEACRETIMEWFRKGTEPQQLDNFWQPFICEGKDKPQYYMVYPDAYRDWAAERGYEPPIECSQIANQTDESSQFTKSEPTIQIVSPLPGDEFQLLSDLPLEDQKIPIRVNLLHLNTYDQSNAFNQIALEIDSQSLKNIDIKGKTAPSSIRESWLPTPGKHTLKVTIEAEESEETLVDQITFFVQK